MGRALQIGTGLGSFAFSIFLDKQKGLTEVNMRKRAIEFRERLTQLGPTFVKVGQGLSTRPDLCPPEYLEELAELQVCIPSTLFVITASHPLILSVLVSSMLDRNCTNYLSERPLGLGRIM